MKYLIAILWMAVLCTSASADPISLSVAALAALGGGSALTGGAMLATGLGAAVTAAGTLAGGANATAVGKMQQTADNYQAGQIRANAGTAVGASQRAMMDQQNRTNLLRSSAVAEGAAGGTETTTGSDVENQSEIVEKGHYNALMDLWNGENKATGLENEAAGEELSGKIAAAGGSMQQKASYYTAAGTLLSGAGSMYKNYSDMQPDSAATS